MERKNMVLLTVIAVATLLVAVVGATFAYFTATVTEGRESGDGKGQGETQLNTATLAGSTTATANIDGQAGSFTANDIFPGHTEYAALSVTVTSTEAKNVAVPFVYEVESNTIGTDIHYYLYRADKKYDDMNMGCVVGVDPDSPTHMSETCDFRNVESSKGHPTSGGDSAEAISELTLVGTGVVTEDANAKYQIMDEITTTGDSSEYTGTAYYYFVIEYKNKTDVSASEGNQDAQQGQSLKGTLTIAGVKATP